MSLTFLLTVCEIVRVFSVTHMFMRKCRYLIYSVVATKQVVSPWICSLFMVIKQNYKYPILLVGHWIWILHNIIHHNINQSNYLNVADTCKYSRYLILFHVFIVNTEQLYYVPWCSSCHRSLTSYFASSFSQMFWNMMDICQFIFSIPLTKLRNPSFLTEEQLIFRA